MTKLSIKAKVTLWYALLMISVIGLVLAVIFYVGNTVLTSSIESRLFEVVEESLQEIGYDEGDFEVEEENWMIEEGVYLSFYTTDGHFIDGNTAPNFTYNVAFSAGEIQTVSIAGSGWAVYDRLIYIDGYGNAWIRGIASFSEAESTIQTMVNVSLIILPFMVIIAIVGGYFITRKAFSPVRKIMDSAESITDGNELSRRINLGKGKDEIYTLANTFDRMFDRLENSFETEKQFTSDVSHELRTPIAVIISQCEYALESAESEQELLGALKVIMGQSQKMSRLIAQLLFLSRSDRKTQPLTIEEVNMSALTEVVIEEQKILADKNNITIHQEIEPDLILQADETMIMSMLINLITNAIKYGKQDGYVFVQLRETGNQIEGVIRDNGIGISESDQSKIWTRFYQVDTARTSEKEGGIGLGLAMVKWIIESHKGTISLESALAKGSTFTFSLPKK
ncbi:sensor histidine kinase [Alkalibacterium olivapovliticus]|uniref:histidine kinase n=1 Tax=Alkalibacterium olivapovliticus TaxID=99907 RepID=A0A2T0VTM9_9LACT|nr:HAMP domain-containing sensor histidine kinase [Alkalibacterium olivapovliticus]PRY74541.1 signal transduction histidine kinase [Alkalibacterium olivapovliticus]